MQHSVIFLPIMSKRGRHGILNLLKAATSCNNTLAILLTIFCRQNIGSSIAVLSARLCILPVQSVKRGGNKDMIGPRVHCIYSMQDLFRLFQVEN